MSSKHSECDENLTEELGDKTLNDENTTPTHLEDQPSHSSLFSDTKSTNEEIVMQSENEQSNKKRSDNIVAISNIECDKDITDIAVESHGGKLIEENVGSDTDRESDRKQVSLMVETHSDSINGNNIFPNQPNEIAMQSEIEQSINKQSDTVVIISNIACDKDITDIAIESHGDKLIEEKIESDTHRESDRKQVSSIVETHSDSINGNNTFQNQPNEIAMQSETEQSNNKQSHTVVIISNIACDKDITDIAIESHGDKLIEEKIESDTHRDSDRKQVSSHSDSINGNNIFQNQPNEIVMQSEIEQSNNKHSDTIVTISKIECDKDMTNIAVESHGGKLIEENVGSDTDRESDRKQVSLMVETHSGSINVNKILPNQPNEIAVQSEIEQSNNKHSDTIVTISKIECDKNITDFPVESYGGKLIEKTIDSNTDRESHSGSVNIISILPNQPNEILDTIEDKDSNATVKEQQPLEEKTPLQGQGDIDNEMDVDLLPTAEQKQITEEKAKDNSIMDAEGAHKKQESCGDVESEYVNNDDNESMTVSSSNIIEDISVDSKTVSSNTDTPVKDLETIVESDMTYGNTEDDKFKLIWEDDDDDSENISETHKVASSDIQVDVSEIENSDIAQTNLDNESFDTTITSNSSFLPSREHGLNKPDVMLEIPMQDLGEFSDDNDDCGQEHLVGLAMSPDVDTGACDELDKSSIPSVGKEAKELVAAEIDLKNGTQNISSNVLEYVNRNYETSTNNQDQLEYPKHNKGHNGSFAKKNKSPSPIVQIEKDTKDENHFSTIVKDKAEFFSGEVKEMDGNQDISETKCDDIQGRDNQKEDIEPQPSTSALSEDNTLANMPQNPDVEEMSDSLGLLAESSRVMDDDEQEEEQDDDGDDDDDSDADDDNSNQMTAENSEDSNVQHTEVDTKEVKNDTPTTSDKEASEDGMNVDVVVPDTVDLNVDEIVIEEATVEDIQVEETDINAVDEVQNGEDYTDNNEQGPVQEAEEMEESIDVPVDIETVKLSDTSDTEMDEKDETNIVEIETNEAASGDNVLDITNYKIADEIVIKGTNKNVLDCVYLEASSSDEEVCEVKKKESESTTVKMPADIDVISSSGGATSDIVMKETETVIRGLPKPPPLKPARINTSEVSIKTTHSTKETFMPLDVKKESSDPVVNLDSDDEEREKPTKTESISLGEEKVVSGIRCVNKKCPHNSAAQYSIADSRAIALFEGDKKKRSYVCEDCYHIVHQKNQELITGILDFKPLMEFDIGNYHEDLVEISDSESEEETEPLKDGGDLIGDKTAKFLEENLTDIFNDMWTKYRMDDRLEDTQAQLQEDLKRLQKESLEIDELFKQCQSANDKLRKELYATFEPDIHELPGIVITDDGESLQISSEFDNKPVPIPENNYTQSTQSTQSKRPRRSTVGWWEPPSKKQAIPMGYTPISTTETEAQAPPEKVDDDNTDISVVKLSLEAAPADLPPPGPLSRAPLRVGMLVYAKKKASWLRATITEILPSKNTAEPFTMCRVKFEHNNLKDPFSTVSGRHLAYSTPAVTRMIIGTRVIALFKDMGIREYYSAGIVAEVPNPVNNYRYLIFFDDGYAQYAAHRETRAVCQSSPLVWEEVHVDSRQFVKDYITSYPERPMVRLHAGQNLKTEFKGKWLSCVVEAVDASLVRVAFADGRREWIYRGSTRLAPLFLELQAAERSRPRAAPRAMPRPIANKGNMPYVEYTRSNEQTKGADARAQNAEEIRRQRSVAKKSTAASQPPPASATNLDDVTSRVVFYTPKNAVKPHKMVPHKCGPQCRRTDVLQLKDLRTYNPLAKPLLSGWERQVVRWRGHKEVMYVGGCGRRLRNMAELHRYLRVTRSDMSVDLFDFSPHTHCLAEFVLNRCIVSKKDLSNGKENVPIPCVNYYDHSLPEFYSYNTERTPTAGVPLNLDPDFLCGCDCEDDCKDKSKCACWQLTLEGARTIRMEGDVGYVYKRLPKPVPSGIYECNSRCKCKHTCLNRVAQHPLQLKLQVFKTLNKGWGIRALNDVPEGSFLCVYAGNLLTDATATLDGLNEGDEFLAELDYIEVVEQMKEGYEEDIPEDAKDQDKEDLSENSSEESSEEEKKSMDEDDVDFMPSYIGPGLTDFTKRLRKRDKKNARDKNKKDNEKSQKSRDKAVKNDEDCITISDDESREPSCFTAAAGMRANEFVSKYKSVRTLYGEDEACYIMDAKVQGNIGRYLNHSCTPNVFVQNVFVDTHDPRFPWVAFFALSHVRAGTELTWNYNYDVGSVPGKVLYCLCGAPNCKGRLL